MPEFQPFVMERLMSKWENLVEFNLSESGVHPAPLRDLVPDPSAIDRLLSTQLGYAQSHGTPRLRERIAALYPGAAPDNVLVTVGCIEANLVALQTLVGPGEAVAIMSPNYLQLWGSAKNLGADVRSFELDPDRGWALDTDSLRRAVTDRTRLIAICNPNNPTGRVLSSGEIDAVVAEAARVGAWILADEVYAGAERTTDAETPSLWGRYDRLLANNSLSKAYGIPGLRIGWVVGPAATIDDIGARHEYTTISAAMLSHELAAIALSADVRPTLIRRTRGFIRAGYPILAAWLAEHGNLFSVTPPDAAAIAFVRYSADLGSSALVDRLIRQKSVLVAPGDHFQVDRHLRISFGLPPDYLRGGLDRLHELFEEIVD